MCFKASVMSAYVLFKENKIYISYLWPFNREDSFCQLDNAVCPKNHLEIEVCVCVCVGAHTRVCQNIQACKFETCSTTECKQLQQAVEIDFTPLTKARGPGAIELKLGQPEQKQEQVPRMLTGLLEQVQCRQSVVHVQSPPVLLMLGLRCQTQRSVRGTALLPAGFSLGLTLLQIHTANNISSHFQPVDLCLALSVSLLCSFQSFLSLRQPQKENQGSCLIQELKILTLIAVDLAILLLQI